MEKRTATKTLTDTFELSEGSSIKKKKPYATLAIEVVYVKHEGNLLVASRKIRPLEDPQVYEWEDATSDDGNIILY